MALKIGMALQIVIKQVSLHDNKDCIERNHVICKIVM
jgi:hypothetical protein